MGKTIGKRQQRHEAIREIVRTHEVRTQRDLVDLLADRGFSCTQATISRDVLEIGLDKAADGCYALPEDARLKRMVAELVESVRAAGNLVVVKTFAGGASSVSAALDKAGIEGVLGTVAGDDTIFLATETPDAARDVEQAIGKLRRR